jgi:carboxyl-terminal processing protease
LSQSVHTYPGGHRWIEQEECLRVKHYVGFGVIRVCRYWAPWYFSIHTLHIMKLLLCPVALFLPLFLWAQPNLLEKLQRKSIVLNRVLQQQHYQPLVWNDATTQLFFSQWMKQLDENQLYFTKGDVAQLRSAANRLADEMNGKYWGFFGESMQLYRHRLLRADSLIKAILAQPIDFARPDTLRWPFVSYSKDYADWVWRWQRSLKWKVLDRIGDLASDSLGRLSLRVPANLDTLEKLARQKVLNQHERTMQHIMGADDSFFVHHFEGHYLNLIASSYDPHTAYMSMHDKKEFETSLSSFTFSTGLEVKMNEKDEWEIVHLVPGGSAWRSGELYPGDVLLKIKISDKPEVDLADVTADMVRYLLQGNSDAALLLTVRQKSGVQKTITLLKEKVEADDTAVMGYVLSKKTKKIGYIMLPDFYTHTDDGADLTGCANDVAKEVLKLKLEGIKGLILDLRNNGGGSIWEAIQLAGIFLNQGVMTSFQQRGEPLVFLKDPSRGTIYDGPLLVLINGGSASASELVSAVLQDYKRAIIVGGNSYGKGTAQSMMPMDTLLAGKKDEAVPADMEDFVKVTMGKFYRVDGNSTQWKGVRPDIVLPDTYSANIKEKSNPTALQPDMGQKAPFTPLNNVFPIQSLAAKSDRRVKNDASFRAVRRMAEWVNQRAKGLTIPLQWPGFAAMTNTNNMLYARLQKDIKGSHPLLQVENTHFEKEKITHQTEANKAANKVRMEKISVDIFLNECMQIMLDWVH